MAERTIDMGNKLGIKRRRETIQEYIARIGVIGVILIFTIFSILGNIAATSSGIVYMTIGVILTAASLYILTAFSEKTVNAYNMWLSLIFIIAFLLRLIILNSWPIEPTSDFKSMYEVALKLSGSEFLERESMVGESLKYYYKLWPDHIPFILIEATILRLFGEGYYPIQVFFNIFSAFSCVLTAMIAKNLYGRRAGITAGLIMSLLPIGLMYSSVLSNQHIATTFFLLSVYILIANPLKQRLTNIAIASIFAAISQIIRSEMTAYIVAGTVYFIYRNIMSVKYKKKLPDATRKTAGYCVMFIGVYITICFATSLIMTESGIAVEKITNTNYKYKVAVGLNAESDGLWNEEDGALIKNNKALDKLIAERSQDKGKVVVLALKKIMYQYGTYNYPWCIENKTGEFAQKWYTPATNGVMFVILLLVLLKGLMALYSKSRRELLLMLIVVSYFVAFMLIEVQNRYNYMLIPIFIIFASGALVRVYEEVQQHIYKQKEQKLEK